MRTVINSIFSLKGKVADLTGAALFLASEASFFVTGHIMAIDGGTLARR